MSLIITKNRIESDQLVNIETPAGTDTHVPIPHATLVNYTRKALDRAGIQIDREEHGLAQGGLCYFGGFALRGEGINGEDRELVLGLRNSHNKRFASAICMGNSMMVCENLCFSSDIKLARKHVGRILEDLPMIIAKGIAQAKSHWDDMSDRIAAYKETDISRSQASDLLIDLVDSKVLKPRYVYSTVKEFENPRHAEFKGGNLWNLYNACTETLKNRSVEVLPELTMGMQSVFDRTANHSPQLTVDNEIGLVLPS